MNATQIDTYRHYIKMAIHDAMQDERQDRVSALKYALEVFEGVLAGRMV